jgi:uncharacterized protein YoxC
MGCFHSSNIRDESKRIDYDFTYTNVRQVDQVFIELRESMSAIEKLRSGIEDNRDALIYKTYAITLKEPSFREAIKIMFWCISANHEGNIRNCQPSVENKAPFVNLNIKPHSDVYPLWATFQHYLKTIAEGFEEIQKELRTTQALLEQVESLSTGGLRRDVENLSEPEKSQATVNGTKSIEKIRRQVQKIQRVKDVINQAKNEIEDMTGYLQGLIENADEVGAKAHEERKLTPEAICNAYHPGPFKAPNEIVELKKEIRKY